MMIKRPRRSRAHLREQDDKNRARESIVWHICKPRQARAFDFRSPMMGSFYAYSLSWTPGSLTLAGDLGELTLVHYHALWDLEGGLAWATSRDIDYLLSKSSRKEVLDADATVDFLIEDANQHALPAEKCLREELREWRADEPERSFTFRRLGFRRRLVRVDSAISRKARRCWLSYKPKRVWGTKQARRYGFMTDVPDAPEGWHQWHKLQEAFSDHLNKDAIFTAAGRREIKEDLQNWMDENHRNEHAVAEKIYGELDMSDWYGSYGWDFRTIQQIEAIRYGAYLALEVVRAENAAAEPRETANV